MNEFDVYLLGKLAGELVFDDVEKMTFQYQADYIQKETIPLSVSMPIREEPYLDKACYIFLQNLLPEESIREKLNTLLNTDSDHLKKIVHVMGGDVAGAVEILPKGDTPYEDKVTRNLGVIDHSVLINNIEDKPFDVTKQSASDYVTGKVTKRRVRMSLAGAQPKLPVRAILGDDGYQILGPDILLSSHIIKPPSKKNTFKSIVLNEYLCMTAAKRSGLSVASVDLIDYINHENIESDALIVERYDRELVDDILVRLHQEDACQALSFSPINKYEYNEDHENLKHGPGYEELARIINEYSSVPAIDKMELLNRIFFNLIIGNNDFHGKNTSFIHLGVNLVHLSPAYDIVCTEVYDEVTHDDAMRMGAAKNIGEATKADLNSMFNALGVNPKGSEKRMLNYCDKALNEMIQVGKIVNEEHAILDSEKRHVLRIIEIAKHNHASLVSLISN